MATLYLRSPYIQILYKNASMIRFYNHITKKTESITATEYSYLDSFQTPSILRRAEKSGTEDLLIKRKLLLPIQSVWNQLKFQNYFA